MNYRLAAVLILMIFITHTSRILPVAPDPQERPENIGSGSATSHGIEGFWEGSIREDGRDARLLLKISRDSNGNLFARIDSPDAGYQDIPVEVITYKAPALHFEVGWAHAVYDGTLSEDGARVSGQQRIGKDLQTLTFKRALSPSLPSVYWPVVMQQQPFHARLTTLQKELAGGNRRALETFWQEMAKQGTPLMEQIEGDDRHLLLTFLWRAARRTRNVVLMSETDHSDPAHNLMTHLRGTDIWYRSYVVANDLRFNYELSPNDSLLPWSQRDAEQNFERDPLNPHKADWGSGVELPAAAAQPWSRPQAGTPLGKVEKQRFRSKFLRQQRDVWVYTPPGYVRTGQPYGWLLFLDGPLYVAMIPTPTILDNLSAQNRLPPLVAVHISSNDRTRDREFGCDPKFENFLIRELVPWVREHYHVTADAGRTMIGGASLGGFAATYVGLRHSEIFGNVLSQGAPFSFKGQCGPEPEWLAAQFGSRPQLALRFYLEVGALETDPDPATKLNQVETNQHLRDILRAKGYTVYYRESRGGHNVFNWRSGVAEGLLALFGKPPA